MVTSKEVFRWVMGIAGTLVTALLVFASSTIYNVDKNIVGIERHLEFITKVLTDHGDTLKDHEQRIRALESKSRGSK